MGLFCPLHWSRQQEGLHLHKLHLSQPINPLNAEIYLQINFLEIKIAQVVEVFLVEGEDPFIINSMAADDLAPCIARVSAALVSAYFSGNVLASVPKGSTCMSDNSLIITSTDSGPTSNCIWKSWDLFSHIEKFMLWIYEMLLEIIDGMKNFKENMPNFVVIFVPYGLMHCGLVLPYGDTDLDQHWFRWKLQI